MSSKIEEIIFPDTFNFLPRLSLWGSSLKTFKFPKNLNSYDIGSIGNLQQLEYFESENPNFIVYGQVVYSKDFTTLIAYPHNCTQIIEHTVTKISGICGFSGYNQPYLKIDLPITSIEDSSFRGCFNLEYLDLSSCIFKTLPQFSIANSPKLKKVILPDTLEQIESSVFQKSVIEELYIASELSEVNPDFGVNPIIKNIYYCGMNTFRISNNNIIQNIFVKPDFPYETFFDVTVTKNYTSCNFPRNPHPSPFPKYCDCITDYFDLYSGLFRNIILYVIVIYDSQTNE